MGNNISRIELLQRALDGVKQLHNKPREVIQHWITELNTIPPDIPLPNGNVAKITVDGYKAILEFADNLRQNEPKIQQTVDVESLKRITVSCFGEMLQDLLEVENMTREQMKNLRGKIFSTIEDKQRPVTHYFPCWLFRELEVAPFSIGSVEFMQLNDWLLKVEQVSKKHQAWIIEIQEYWQGERSFDSLENEISKIVTSAVDGYIWIAAVRIENHEWKKSYERARYAVRLALDALGLTIKPSHVKNLQLKAEANLPSSIMKISQFDGCELGFPGVEHNRTGIYESANPLLETNSDFLKAAGRLINTIVSLESDRNTPKLDERWLNALYWYGEACREPEDFIARVKLGVSLDILAMGKNSGIREFTRKLFGKNDNEPITRDGTTLKQVVEDLYEKGRSQISHGSQLGILEDFSFSRECSSFFVREVLYEAIVRLSAYHGKDDLEAFKNIL